MNCINNNSCHFWTALIVAVSLSITLSIAPTQAAVILVVDVSDFFDSDAGTNSLKLSGVSGALPEVTVTANGNFPELDLRNFFTSPKSGLQISSAIMEGLADFMGRTYGLSFLSGVFGCRVNVDPDCIPRITDIPNTSLGILATNGQNHDFDTAQTALTGLSVFNVGALGFSASDFGTGGDVFAQDFPFVRIGQWRAVGLNSSVPEPTTLTLLGLGILAGIVRRRCG
ncbi:MAG: PEP-CTERM sorting domain-containing protein [Candidatus Methylumidiphilus sp.]